MSEVVLITGASTGFGRLLAEVLVQEGSVAVATMRDVGGRNASNAAALREGGCDVVELDVTDDASVDAATAEVLERHGRIDVLVNNAGFGMAGALETVTPDDLRTVLETNVVGAHRMVRAVLPSMRERGSGLLIHISSGAGRLAFPGAGAYCATKWALEALGETLRYEVGPFGIDSVLVEPGRYETDFHSRSLHRGSDTDRASSYGFVNEGLAARNERLKPGDPREVVDAILELMRTLRGERPTRVFLQPGGGDVLSELNRQQSELARGLLTLFDDERFVSNGT